MSSTTTTRIRPTKYLGAYVAKDTLEKIEKLRGQVPRSRIIENALMQYLETQGERNNEK
jgi:hypothetical protein